MPGWNYIFIGAQARLRCRIRFVEGCRWCALFCVKMPGCEVFDVLV